MKRGIVPIWLIILILLIALVLWIVGSAVRQVEQYQRGVVFRFGP